jgi:thiol:disulfide interchange protein
VSATSSSTPPPARRRPSRETILWIAVVAIAVSMQWPMLKGWYYRATGTRPPEAAIAWRADFPAALDEARRTNRQVLVDMSADWCPPCVAMKHDVWPDPEVAQLIDASFVPLLVNADLDTEISARYDVASLPTILILAPDGSLVARAGYLPASGMRRFLREHAK